MGARYVAPVSRAGGDGGGVDRELELLIDLQGFDSRIAGLERETARLPTEIHAIQTGIASARAAVESSKARLEATKKAIRAKEKDLDVSAAKRSKGEARLYEVKTNKEYTAALVEIEDIKQEKSRIEEEILTLMETQERLAAEIREAEAELARREAAGGADEAVVRQRLAAVEAELAGVRTERTTLARAVAPAVLADYDKLRKARGGLALAQALPSHTCAGCRMSIRPQALLEVRAQTRLVTCESCGRYLYWRDPA
jgi:predicted  nucleic acid-binding Zn-ribbon protein